MKNMKGIALIVAAISIAVLLILSISLESGVSLYSIHENIASNPNVPFTQYSWLIMPFDDTAGMTIARLELLIPSQVLPSSNNSLSIAVSVEHIDGTHLDSLRLTFSILN